MNEWTERQTAFNVIEGGRCGGRKTLAGKLSRKKISEHHKKYNGKKTAVKHKSYTKQLLPATTNSLHTNNTHTRDIFATLCCRYT